MSEHDGQGLRIGWASADLTPSVPVLMAGQMHARVSEGVADPITATAMAMDSEKAGDDSRGTGQRAVMVSCDLVVIPDELTSAVRARLGRDLPELDPMDVMFNATHTHTGPEVRNAMGLVYIPPEMGPDLGVDTPDGYAHWAADRITEMVIEAWNRRRPAGIGFGLGHAAIGYNRRVSYYTGRTEMYGGVDHPEFSHLESGNDSSINILCTWDQHEQLTGIVINLACPSQVSEQDYHLSADYWCETRALLRERLGRDLFILPQVSAAGDLVPAKSQKTVPDWRALDRMRQAQGLTQREQIAAQITRAVIPVVESVGRQIEWQPILIHHVEHLSLSYRHLTQQDVDDAEANAGEYEKKYHALRAELEAHPEMKNQPRWYKPVTYAHRRMLWNRTVGQRYERQKTEPTRPTEVHVVRLGQIVFASNPFEYYLDFGLQIKARSEATQTFIVQLAGAGTYLPTRRAVEGKSYGAVPASTPVGPEGGRELVDGTVEAINNLFG